MNLILTVPHIKRSHQLKLRKASSPGTIPLELGLSSALQRFQIHSLARFLSLIITRNCEFNLMDLCLFNRKNRTVSRQPMKKFPLMHSKIVTTQLPFYAVNLLSPIFEANQSLSIEPSLCLITQLVTSITCGILNQKLSGQCLQGILWGKSINKEDPSFRFLFHGQRGK